MAKEFSAARTARFLTSMAASVKAGMPMSQMLDMMQGRNVPPDMRRIWARVAHDIQRGSTFGEALGRSSPPVPKLCAEMLSAGEQSGRLDAVLPQLRAYYDMKASLQRAALGASIYPAFVLLFALGVTTLLRTITADDKMAALVTSGVEVGVALAVLVGVVAFFRMTPPGRSIWQGFIIHIPVIGGAVRRLALARFCRTMSMMFASGFGAEHAVHRACAAMGNVHMERSLRRSGRRLKRGDRLAEAFGDNPYVPSLMREMLDTGERTGTYDETLMNVADVYDDEAKMVLVNLPKLIGPIMVIGIGSLVIYLYWTYYLKPLTDVINSVS